MHMLPLVSSAKSAKKGQIGVFVKENRPKLKRRRLDHREMKENKILIGTIVISECTYSLYSALLRPGPS